MNRAIEMHRLRPVIYRTFPFAEARDAYRHFESRGHFGKIVITHCQSSATNTSGHSPARTEKAKVRFSRDYAILAIRG
ncbi:MAG: zinc-binding dehydrogenase [Acetobacteraceae bacterium]|nr:zinc-binding dehydrogenase [Acetobacteraceae bacterium]